MNDLFEKAAVQIIGDIDIQIDEGADSQDELLFAIEKRVNELFETQPDLLMSYLYRLDVSEAKVNEAMASNENVIIKISNLILERQLQRVKTKQELKQDPIEGWEW